MLLAKIGLIFISTILALLVLLLFNVLLYLWRKESLKEERDKEDFRYIVGIKKDKDGAWKLKRSKSC